MCFLIIGTRGQGFIEFFFEKKSKVFLKTVRLCSRERAEKWLLRWFERIFSFPFDCRAKLFQCSPRESDDLLGSEQKIEPQLFLSA